MTGDIQPLKHDMTTDELLAAWKRRLPNTEPTDNQLSCFAIGIEVGRATDAQDTHLIAAAVREQCARICDAMTDKVVVRHPARVEYDPDSTMARKSAAAIRASAMPAPEPGAATGILHRVRSTARPT